MALTGKNEIVGTLYYMSPEQLQSQATARRSTAAATSSRSAWCCTRCSPASELFEGASPASVIAAIMERPAPSIANVAPAALDRVLQRCLAKDPDDRWQTARDLKAELEWIAHAPESAPESGSAVRKIAAGLDGVDRGRSVGRGCDSRWMRLVARHATGRPAADSPQRRPGQRCRAGLADIRDSLSRMARASSTQAKAAAGSRQLYTRRLDQPTATLVSPDTGGQDFEPFFSPNGEWIAFWSHEGKIVKVPAQGGELIPLGSHPPELRGCKLGRRRQYYFG